MYFYKLSHLIHSWVLHTHYTKDILLSEDFWRNKWPQKFTPQLDLWGGKDGYQVAFPAPKAEDKEDKDHKDQSNLLTHWPLRGTTSCLLINILIRQKCRTRELLLCPPGSSHKTRLFPDEKKGAEERWAMLCHLIRPDNRPYPIEFVITGIAKDFRQSPCGFVGPSYISDAFSSTLWYCAHCSCYKSDHTGCF